MKLVRKHSLKMQEVLTPERQQLVIDQDQSILQYCHEQALWIACDCHAREPLLTVRRYEGNYHLVHMTQRGGHTEGCTLKELPSRSKDVSQGTRQSKKAVLAFHYALPEQNGSPTSKTSERPGSGIRQSKLQRLLLTLLEDAGLNRTTAVPLGVFDQYKALWKAANKFTTFAGNKNFGDFFWTSPDALLRAQDRLKESEGTWAHQYRPHGVFAIVCDEVRGHHASGQVHNDPFTFKFPTDIQKAGRPGKTGPWMVGFTFADSPEQPHDYQPQRAVAVPVLSKGHLLPVESHYERKTLAYLIKSLLPWLAKKGVPVALNKPLFDIETPLGSCRPDVIIEDDKNNRLIIEIMGSNDELYRASKEETVPRMETLCPVIEFQAHVADQRNTWGKDLSQLFRIVSGRLFGMRDAA